jgi:hypothetical protein
MEGQDVIMLSCVDENVSTIKTTEKFILQDNKVYVTNVNLNTCQETKNSQQHRDIPKGQTATYFKIFNDLNIWEQQ